MYRYIHQTAKIIETRLIATREPQNACVHFLMPRETADKNEAASRSAHNVAAADEFS